MTDFMQQSLCWLNGTIVDARKACIPVMDHGLLYGDGIFEGIRFYYNVPFRLEEHLKRLYQSARAINLSVPLQKRDMEMAVKELIAAYTGEHGYLRLVVTRGSGSLGLDPDRCKEPNIVIIADDMELVDPEKSQDGIRVMIASTRRLAVDGLDPRIKSLNYLNHILARMEARHAGFEEAILLNAQGHVTEGTADNIFIVRDDILHTPALHDGALDGITRQIILDLAAMHGYKTRETTLAPYDLFTAEECFLTGTGAGLIPVREINGRKITHCPGPVFNRMQEAYEELIRKECMTEYR